MKGHHDRMGIDDAYVDQLYDADPAGGVIEIRNMSPGQYKFCETLPPQGYGVVNPSCQTVSIAIGQTSQLVFKHLPVAHIKWSVKDFAGNYVSGATFTLDSNNVVVTKVGDGSFWDTDPAPGKFDVKIPFESKWKLCATTPPAGYVFQANQVLCVTKKIKQGTVLDFGTFGVNPVYSGFRGVTNGYLDPVQGYYLIGPSTFKVTSSDQAYSYDVVDDSTNDVDPTPGKIAVKFLKGGTWSVCETQPPVNHRDADPDDVEETGLRLARSIASWEPSACRSETGRRPRKRCQRCRWLGSVCRSR